MAEAGARPNRRPTGFVLGWAARGAADGWPRLLAVAALAFWIIVCVPLFWANDALGYQAAGERLNAGHGLYALAPGDRPVEIHPPFWSSPFLYPPLWGVVWRPIAALPFGLALWMAIVGGAMLWWAWTARPWVVAAVSIPFGMLLASGNVAGLILVAMSGVASASPRTAGLLVGAMTAVKGFPGVLIVWFLVTGRIRAAAWTVGTAAALSLIGFLYDPALTWQYVREVIPSTQLLGSAPAALVGIPTWASWVVLVAAVAWTIRARSFAAAVTAVVLGAPAGGFAGLAQLGAGVPGRESPARVEPSGDQLAADSARRTARAPSS